MKKNKYKKLLKLLSLLMIFTILININIGYQFMPNGQIMKKISLGETVNAELPWENLGQIQLYCESDESIYQSMYRGKLVSDSNNGYTFLQQYYDVYKGDIYKWPGNSYTIWSMPTAEASKYRYKFTIISIISPNYNKGSININNNILNTVGQSWTLEDISNVNIVNVKDPFGNYGYITVKVEYQFKNYNPAITAMEPANNAIIYGTDKAYVPSVKIYDKNDDTVTCKYYIDNETTPRETKTISNTSTTPTLNFSPIDSTLLAEGNHTIKYEAADGREAPVFYTVSFKVDHSAPNINNFVASSTPNTITISGTATDAVAGLNTSPYRYTLSTKTATAWTTATSYTYDLLTPNTQYTATFEARDQISNLSSKTQNIYTKAALPNAAISNLTSSTLDLSVSDNNPTNTQYLIQMDNSQYITPEGYSTSSPVWFPLNIKKLTIKSLVPSSTHSFNVMARNGANEETTWSAPVSGTTLMAPPAPPVNITATATGSTITLTWDPAADSTGYDIEADGNLLNLGTATTYTHTGLTPYTQHNYRVRARNAGGTGDWSTVVQKYTQQADPNTPFNIEAAATLNSVIVTWKPIPGATAYDIEVDGNLLNNGSGTSYVHGGLQPGTLHSYRVRSINSGGKSEWSNEVLISTQTEAPMIPANLRVLPGSGQITLTWDNIPGATYEIEMDGSIRDVGSSSTFLHNELLPGSSHNYRVRAKKAGSLSEWSTYVTAVLPLEEFGTPKGIHIESSDTSIAITWQPVINATGYDIEIDGSILQNGSETACLLENLAPNSQHLLRIRAVSADKQSDWSEYTPVLTYALPTPTGLLTIATGDTVSITWNGVEGAAAYDIDIDGQLIPDILTMPYTHPGLDNQSQHTYKIRAKGQTGISAWSKPYTDAPQTGGGNAPTGILAKATTDNIQLIWKNIEGADNYQLEIDGNMAETTVRTNYTHSALAPDTLHTYRIRAVTQGLPGDWSKTVALKTLALTPTVPGGLTASATTSGILLTWDKIDQAIEYELEIDGAILNTGTNTKYLHGGLLPDSSHTYRVRARNLSGQSAWSEKLEISTKSAVETYNLQTTEGETFNLILNAQDITDPSKYTYTITYDPEALEAIDLCGETFRSDMGVGPVIGSDIQILQYTPGTILFKKTGSTGGQAHTGTINSIKFQSKTQGETQITYSFE